MSVMCSIMACFSCLCFSHFFSFFRLLYSSLDVQSNPVLQHVYATLFLVENKCLFAGFFYWNWTNVSLLDIHQLLLDHQTQMGMAVYAACRCERSWSP